MFLLQLKMLDPLLLLLMASMAIVTLPLAQGQVSGISAKDDIISSANFPSSYGNGIEATHSISVLPTNSLSIRFIEFDLEYESNCGYDSLKIVDTSGKDLFFGCGQMHGKSFPAAENFPSLIETSLGVTITFKTDGSVTKKGFQLKVQQLGEKSTPTYDPELTPSEDNTCVDGKCAYVGGGLASTFADLLSNSNEIIEVECCNSGGIIDDTIRTCGNGTSCSTICGPFSGCLTIKAMKETENSKTCSSIMDTENWCQQSDIIDELAGKTVVLILEQGDRKKRKAWLHALPIYRIWYCPQRVRTVGSLARYPECCLHPAVRQRNSAIKKECCMTNSVCV